jgi:hypothetical protein
MKSADMVMFFNRDGKWVERPLPSDGETLPPLPDEAYEEGATRRLATTFTARKRMAGMVGEFRQAEARQSRRGLRRLLPEPSQARADSAGNRSGWDRAPCPVMKSKPH